MNLHPFLCVTGDRFENLSVANVNYEDLSFEVSDAHTCLRLKASSKLQMQEWLQSLPVCGVRGGSDVRSGSYFGSGSNLGSFLHVGSDSDVGSGGKCDGAGKRAWPFTRPLLDVAADQLNQELVLLDLLRRQRLMWDRDGEVVADEMGGGNAALLYSTSQGLGLRSAQTIAWDVRDWNFDV
jgi:hypothetical protein